MTGLSATSTRPSCPSRPRSKFGRGKARTWLFVEACQRSRLSPPALWQDATARTWCLRGSRSMGRKEPPLAGK